MFNPKLQKPKRKYSFLESRAYLAVAVVVFFGIIYGLFFSPVFEIKKVIVNELSFTSKNEIERKISERFLTKRALIMPQKNIFIFSEVQAKNELAKSDPVISKIVFKKEFPDILRVEVMEREIAAYFSQKENEYYFLSLDGVICKKATAEEVNARKLPKILSNRQNGVNLGDEITTPKIVFFVKELEKQLSSKTGLAAVHFLLPTPKAPEIHVKTETGFEIFFSLDREVTGQIDNLKLVLSKEIKKNFTEIEYIDLRVDNWIYYK